MSDFTQADLDTLNKAIAQGALKVKYSDKEVTYRSLDEMIKIRNLMKKDLGITSKAPSRVLASFSKGT
ncbi:MAG: hypothetical protein CMP22_07805 [Rickettsiales bacterium]|nr:hypothetical protein [Rickettsiales bacterium]|tara:strand:+ start:567 stop:770 length:204 start_codon:yes stop_codon:yes gene_type:complete